MLQNADFFVIIDQLNNFQFNDMSASVLTIFPELANIMSSKPEMPWMPKPPEQKICSTDLLVLSAAWYRLRQDPGASPFDSLVDVELINSVIPGDISFAEQIRDHFDKKFTYWALIDRKLSKFRTDLKDFIMSDRRTYTEELLPLVYRLPEFYLYDLTIEKLQYDFTPTPERCKMLDLNLTLYPVSYTTRKLKSGLKHEYWLKDDSNHAYQVLIEPNNNCKSLWDREFKLKALRVHGKQLARKTVDQFSFRQITKWDIIT